MPSLYGFDAYSPGEVARRVENVGVAKARLPLVQTALLGVLAGAFIGLGALVFTLVASDATLGFATSRLLGGLCFSLGLILVSVAGAELFTGNNLLAMAWADGRISTFELLRNWAVVCLANFAGAAGLAVLVWLSGHAAMNGNAVAETAVRIATAKVALPWREAFFLGVLCNLLVCMAVWMAMVGRSGRTGGARARLGGPVRQPGAGDRRQPRRRQRAGSAGVSPDLPEGGTFQRASSAARLRVPIRAGRPAGPCLRHSAGKR